MSDELTQTDYSGLKFREGQTNTLADNVKLLSELQHKANELTFQLSMINNQINELQNERIIPALKEQRDVTGQDSSVYTNDEGHKLTVKLSHKVRGSISYANAKQAGEIMERISGKQFGWNIKVSGNQTVLDMLSEQGYDAKGKPDIKWNTLAAEIKKGIKEGTLSDEDMEVLKVTIEDELEVKES